MICTYRFTLDVGCFDKRENYGVIEKQLLQGVIEKQLLQDINQNQSSCEVFPPSGLDKVMAFRGWRFSVSPVGCTRYYGFCQSLVSLSCLMQTTIDYYSVYFKESGSMGLSVPKHMSSSQDN